MLFMTLQETFCLLLLESDNMSKVDTVLEQKAFHRVCRLLRRELEGTSAIARVKAHDRGTVRERERE